MLTTYINVKIMPEDQPSDIELKQLQDTIQSTLNGLGIPGYVHTHQLDKGVQEAVAV
jgi:translation elongation factor EF-1beta